MNSSAYVWLAQPRKNESRPTVKTLSGLYPFAEMVQVVVKRLVHAREPEEHQRTTKREYARVENSALDAIAPKPQSVRVLVCEMPPQCILS